jgi:putative selenate reductase molybdopterin-binding subunit
VQIELQVNGKTLALDVTPQTTLLQSLRESGFYSVKRGCDTGDCGACAVLLDGKLVNSCALLTVQAAGKHILTTEGLGEAADQGWKTTPGLHPLQEAFAEEGAIQCGYCTPAMLMAAKELLDRKGYGGPHPLPLDAACGARRQGSR